MATSHCSFCQVCLVRDCKSRDDDGLTDGSLPFLKPARDRQYEHSCNLEKLHHDLPWYMPKNLSFSSMSYDAQLAPRAFPEFAALVAWLLRLPVPSAWGPRVC